MRKKKVFALLTSTLAAAAVCLACSSSDSDGTGEATTQQSQPDAAVTCTNDPRVTTYVANVSAMTQSQTFKVAIAEATPAPPTRGDNTWRIVVTNADGSPLAADATISTDGSMPDHGHRSPSVPTVTRQDDGSFVVSPLDLFMPGVWEISVRVRSGASEDVALFSFCVDG